MEQEQKENPEVKFLQAAYNVLEDIYEKNSLPDKAKEWEKK